MTPAPFPVQQKASLAINHASEALSLCAMAKRGSGTCPYIPKACVLCLCKGLDRRAMARSGPQFAIPPHLFQVISCYECANPAFFLF